MDSFKDLLTKTVGQIKRANEYLAEQPTKTSFKGSTVQNFAAVQRTRPVRRRRPLFQLSTTDPRQWERRRPPQVHRCNPSLLCQTFLFFAFSSTQCRDLFCLWKAFLLPDDGQAKHPKLLNGQMKDNNQVQSILI